MENKTMESLQATSNAAFISPEAMLTHWQGHRRLTRKVIEAFPENKLFTYAVGGMRPFAQLAMEMIQMAAPGIRGIVIGQWPTWQEVEKDYPVPGTREDLLALWDRTTEQLDSLWPHITPERFQEVDKMFGQYEGTIYWNVLYLVDNEIHHRGQGYVYLRSLGITPPPFWER